MTVPDPRGAIAPAQTTSAREEAHAFIGKLFRYASDEQESPQLQSRNRAALAALRRGLGKSPGEAPEMFPYIIPILPEKLSARHERLYYLVASLFAFYRPGRHTAAESNFGAAYRRLIEATGSDSVERRFLALLDAPMSNLPDHLRHAIGQMAANSHRIPVAWASLLADLLSWDAEDRWVQRKWARGFYAPQLSAATASTESSWSQEGS